MVMLLRVDARRLFGVSLQRHLEHDAKLAPEEDPVQSERGDHLDFVSFTFYTRRKHRSETSVF